MLFTAVGYGWANLIKKTTQCCFLWFSFIFMGGCLSSFFCILSSFFSNFSSFFNCFVSPAIDSGLCHCIVLIVTFFVRIDGFNSVNLIS